MMKNFPFWGALLLSVQVFAQEGNAPDPSRSIDSLIELSRTLTTSFAFEQALKASGEAERQTFKYFGPGTSRYAKSCHAQGRVYQFSGKYNDAEKWYSSALSNWEQSVGKESIPYAQTMNNLANVYWKMGNYERAEALHLEAKDIRGRLLGKNSQEYGATLANLANVYHEMGNNERAIELQLEAITILEKTQGKEHPDYALSLLYLGNIYFETEKYAQALAYFQEANALQKKVLGTENQDYTISLNNMANSYFRMGNFVKAEQLYLEANAIQERILGRRHRDYALTITNMASLYLALGEYERAESYFQEARTIWEGLPDLEHPEYLQILDGLIDLSLLKGNVDRAKEYIVMVGDKRKILLQKASGYLSEHELLLYVKQFEQNLNRDYSFACAAGLLSTLCYDNLLFYKGFLLNTVTQINNLAMSDSSSAGQLSRLKSVRRRLSVEYSKAQADRDTLHIADLEETANRIEKELARAIADYGNAIRQVNWKEVQAALKNDEAAVEFFHFQVNTPRPIDTIRYAALILRPGDLQPQVVPLFDEKQLLALTKGVSGGNNFLKINSLYENPSLFNLVLQPLEKYLSGVGTVFFSPDGLLQRLNLPAISMQFEHRGVQSRHWVQVGSTRNLVVSSKGHDYADGAAYLAGGIRYDSDSTAIARANFRSVGSRNLALPGDAPVLQRNGIHRGSVLDYLPETTQEVLDIGQTLAKEHIQYTVDTGYLATEEVFRQLGASAPSPRIIHLATHGYFFPDPAINIKKTLPGNAEPVFKLSDHPMIRSGLLLAGAKQAWLTGKHPEGQEDGILTAYEISQMSLRNTELVVLSACETGLGDIVGNEGVYGLQRAFKIAGARYLIMSLWKVGDQSTRVFMTTFYRHWLTEGQTVPQAFRRTQEEMRAKYSGAYDWAGFVLIE